MPKLLNADWNYWSEKHSAESIWTVSAALGFDGSKPLEMHGNAHAAMRLCEAVGSPALGVLLDTGHALWAGEDLPVALHLIGDRLKHVHLGDTSGPVEADLPPGWHHDFTAFMTAIDEIGYRGAMSLDMYGAVEGGVLSSEAASRYGYETMVAAAARARAGR